MIKFRILPEDTTLDDFQKEFPNMQISTANNLQTAFDDLGVHPYPLNFRTPITLIKVGEKKYMKKLLENGEVFMRTTTYFRELEAGTNDSSDGRGDAYEGVDVVLPADEIIVDGTSIRNPSPIRGKFSNNNDGLIFSIFGVFDDSMLDGNITIPDDMRRMGDTAVVISDPMVFLDRCASYIKNIGGKVMAGSVTYYDEKAGAYTMCPWLKRKIFEYQSEYRLFIPCGNRNPLTLRLGSIEDIAEMKTL